MNERELRKQLTVMVYGMIFKKVLPTSDGLERIGNIEHANRINRLIEDRSIEGYEDSQFSYLELYQKSNDSVKNPVKENNFNNWVNGTSNPKNYQIINALIEYVADCCVSPERQRLLAYELTTIITSDVFRLYTHERIESYILEWKEALLSPHMTAIETVRILKELLYLLKEKDRHIAYLLHRGSDVVAITNSLSNDASSTLTSSPLSSKKRSITYISLFAITLTLILCTTFSLSKLNNDTKSDLQDGTDSKDVYASDNSSSSFEYEILDQVDHETLPKAQLVENLNEISALPSSEDLHMPNLIHPKQNSTIPYDNLTISWAAVQQANNYQIVLINRKGQEVVFEQKGISSETITIDQKYFLHGEYYDILLTAYQGDSHSESAKATVQIEPLLPPVFITPSHDLEMNIGSIEVHWSIVEGADSYSIIVTDTSRWVKIYEKKYIVQNHISLDESLFLPGVTYRIYLASENSSIDSQPNYIDVTFKELEPPQIISPLNNTILTDDSLFLQWSSVKSSSNYRLDIVETNTWDTVYTRTGILDTELIVDSKIFQPGGTYRVYIFALLGTYSTAPSYIDLIGSQLSAPEIKAPMDGALLPPDDLRIDWTAIPEASSYNLMVKDLHTWEPILELKSISDTSVLLDKALLSLGHPYRIYLSSMSGDIETAPNYIDFQFEDAQIPSIISPLRNSTFSEQDVLIEWQPINYITTFRLTLTDTNTWDNIIENERIKNEQFTIKSNLLTPGHSYRFYVQSIFGDMESSPTYIDFIYN